MDHKKDHGNPRGLFYFSGMRKICTNHFLLRMAFLLSLLLLSLFDIFLAEPATRLLGLCADVLCCGVILVLSPLSYEKTQKPLRLALCLGLLLAGAKWAELNFPLDRVLPETPSVYVLAISNLSLLAFIVTTCRDRYSTLRGQFNNTAAWRNLEAYSRLFHSFILLWLLGLCLALRLSDAGPVPAAVLLAAGLSLDAVLYFKAYSGRTMIVGKRMERQIQDVMSSNLRSAPLLQEEDSPAMSRIYHGILSYMEMRKPFLDPDFSISDLSEGVMSNRSYVSKTINIFSGQNFRQFVNHYRVLHAASLFSKDPELRVMEAAILSGFHSVVSFTMAFKTHMNVTPSDYIVGVKEKMAKAYQHPPLSTSGEEGP